MTRGATRSLAVASCLLSTTLAVAQSEPNARAVELFDKGRALVLQGQCAKAIPLFRASIAVERTVGALLNLGECLAQASEPLLAWRAFKDAEKVATEKTDPRSVDARKRAAGVEAVLLKITAAVEGPIEGVEFRVDGERIETKSMLEGLCVAPGKHEIVATRGDMTWTRDIIGSQGSSIAVAVTFAAPARALEPAVGEPRDVPVDVPAPRSGQKTVSYVVAAAGLLGVAVGSYFGIRTIGDVKDAKRACGPTFPNDCIDHGAATEAHRAATIDGLVSTIAFVVGAGGLLGGAVLYLTAPSRASEPPRAFRIVPRVGVSSATLSLEHPW